MSQLLTSLLLWIVSVLLWVLISTQRRRSSRVLRNTCSPIPNISSRYLLGLDTTWTYAAKTFGGNTIRFIHDAIFSSRTHTFQYWFLRRHVIFTAAPANYKSVFSSDFKDFELPETRNGALYPVLGASVFSQNGEGWRKSRAALRPWFAPKYTSNLDAVEKNVRALLESLEWNAEGVCDKTDLYEVFGGLTINNTMEFLFGKPQSSTDAATPSSWYDICTRPLNKDGSFLNIMDYSIRYSGLRVAAGAAYWMVDSTRYRRACKVIRTFVDERISYALDQNEDEETFSLVKALARGEADADALRAHLTTMMQAGTESSRVTLSFLFQSLAKHPSTFTKLRNVVLSTFGPYDQPSSTPITANTLKSCIYLQSCINEALRLFPTVSMNARVAMRDTTLPAGGGPDASDRVFVPKGTKVQVASFITHRLESIWGTDAEEWRPERWEVSEQETGGREAGVSAWETGFLPFSGGPRVCLGQHLATTTIAYTTVRLMQYLTKLEPHPEADYQLRYNGVSLAPKNGVLVRMRAGGAASSGVTTE